MLDFFPMPYPDELWHSIMCRYYIRSGCMDVIKGENRESFVAGLLYSNNSICETMRQIPKGIFSAQDMILNHTMFPYFNRMLPYDEKNRLLVRHVYGMFQPERDAGYQLSKSITPKLKYCPVCMKQDQEQCGESYWHREHQLPYMKICRKHKCRLKICTGKTKCDFERRPLLPEFVDQGEEPDYFVEAYEPILSELLYEYLTLPWELGPTEGYNNLFCGLETAGYKTPRNKRNTANLDGKKLYEDLSAFYGVSFVAMRFGKSMTEFMPLQLKNWKLYTPERYIMLAGLIGQRAEVTFGKRLEPVNGTEVRAIRMDGQTEGKPYYSRNLRARVQVC